MVRGRGWAAACLLVALLALLAVPAIGAPVDPPVPYAGPSWDLPPGHEKLSSDLLALVDDRFLLPNQSRADTVAALAQSGRYARGGQRYRGLGTPATDLVGVYVRTLSGTGAGPLRPYINSLMAEDPEYGLVAAWVEPRRLLTLAQQPSVREVRPVLRPRVRTGSVTTVGDTVLHAQELRQATGVSGSGIKVGVISDGVDAWQTSRSSGDLPASIQVLKNSLGGNEGTAMLEIVHDLAPNASLAFHDCGWSVIEFNQAIDALADAGCQVIVDDIGWVEEPFFEDGLVAAHVEDVVRDRGVVFVSATGNDADVHYQGAYRDDGDQWHDFSGGTNPDKNRLYVTIPRGGSVEVVLQWSEPFGASSSDYDLYLYKTADTSSPLAISAMDQSGGNDPLEYLFWENDGLQTVAAEIDVHNPYSAPPATLEVFVYPASGASFSSTNAVMADSIYGHPAAKGAIGVAAIDAGDPTSSGLEYFSSRGPVTIIAPGTELRQKPDCAGLDGVRVTGAGGFPSVFWGTSAAAPHAAGIAALVWSGNLSAPAADVRKALLASATDLGPAGWDPAFGAGLLNATAMHALLSPTPVGPVVPPLPGGGTPQDLDKDGLYEDVNGNNRADFADVVLLFNQADWVAEHAPIAAFDFNKNGRIDFADIVLLFEQL
ncbi:MAG: S8 family serine peptidase [Methanoregulaceae archaeon]